jgi:hypothetical protein
MSNSSFMLVMSNVLLTVSYGTSLPIGTPPPSPHLRRAVEETVART